MSLVRYGEALERFCDSKIPPSRRSAAVLGRSGARPLRSHSAQSEAIPRAPLAKRRPKTCHTTTHGGRCMSSTTSSPAATHTYNDKLQLGKYPLTHSGSLINHSSTQLNSNIHRPHHRVNRIRVSLQAVPRLSVRRAAGGEGQAVKQIETSC